MPITAVESITQCREYMKPKLHPIFIIVGLFLFKVGIVDNMRHFGHSEHEREQARTIASEPPSNALKPIR